MTLKFMLKKCTNQTAKWRPSDGEKIPNLFVQEGDFPTPLGGQFENH